MLLEEEKQIVNQIFNQTKKTLKLYKKLIKFEMVNLFATIEYDEIVNEIKNNVQFEEELYSQLELSPEDGDEIIEKLTIENNKPEDKKMS